MLLIIRLGILCLACGPVATAQETGDTVITIAGQRIPMQIRSLDSQTVTGARRTLAFSDLMMIDTGRPVQDSSLPLRVYLSGGGILPASAVTFNGEEFRIATSWGTPVLATDAVSGVVLDRAADPLSFRQAMQKRSVENDVVVATSSRGQQAVAGLLESIDGEKLVLNYQGQSRPINLSKVKAIVTADLKLPPVRGPVARVQLTDGGTVSAVIDKLESGTLSLRLPANPALQLPWDMVSRISIASDSVVWLSDLEPASAEQTPLAALPFQWKRDTSAGGNPLTLVWPSSGEKRVFARGIGTRSASRLEFDVDGRYGRLVATVGIDAETEGRGDCEVSIWGDGVQLWGGEVTGRTDPLPVDLDISGIRRVTLVTRHGRHLDLGDHVDWADARFLQTTDPLP